jgi:hypothetical protein
MHLWTETLSKCFVGLTKYVDGIMQERVCLLADTVETHVSLPRQLLSAHARFPNARRIARALAAGCAVCT